MKTTIFNWTVLFLLLYISAEALIYCGLFYLNEKKYITYSPADVLSSWHKTIIETMLNKRTSYLAIDPRLGWNIQSDGRSIPYRANHSGIRADREYELTPRPDKIRIAAFGDSYTHCDDVANNQTWEYYLEAMHPGTEVLNFGVPGYGLDQAYLHYKQDGVKFRSQIVIIGFMADDIFRQVSTFRPFYFSATGMPLSKPRFVLKSEKPELVGNKICSPEEYRRLITSDSDQMLKDLGQNDYYYQFCYRSGAFDFSPVVRMTKMISGEIKKQYYQDIIKNGQYNPKSEACIITEKIFEAFYSEVIKNNSIPVILIFPSKSDVESFYAGKPVRYEPLITYFKSRAFRYIDLVNMFNESGRSYKTWELFRDHYTPKANRLVAEYVNKQINNYKPLPGCGPDE